jgi:hypothetical protein
VVRDRLALAPRSPLIRHSEWRVDAPGPSSDVALPVALGSGGPYVRPALEGRYPSANMRPYGIEQFYLGKKDGIPWARRKTIRDND